MIRPSIFPSNITCAYSTNEYGEVAPFREKGDGLQDQLSAITIRNRASFLHDVDLKNTQLVELQQLHTDKVVQVTTEHAGKGYVAIADAMVTDQKHVVLSVCTSDCLPVCMYDPIQGVIAVVHAGWRGVHGRIILKTIVKMTQTYGSQPKDILAWIGPAISGESYGFKKELFDTQDANRYFKQLGGITETKDMFYTDLKKVAQEQLLRAGVTSSHIEISDICTYENESFFSYRSGDRTNNMGIMVMN